MLKAVKLFLGGSIIALIFAGNVDAEEQCHLYRLASVEMQFDQYGGVYVPMRIENRSFNLLVDTGGIYSMLTDDSVNELGLKRGDVGSGAIVEMFGGIVIQQTAVARDIQFGELTAHDTAFLVLPNDRLPPELGGLLGANIMKDYDVEFDFGSGIFNLFSQDHCEGDVVYWTKQAFGKIGMHISGSHIVVPVQLDGQEIDAVIDTGSDTSMMSLETVKRLFGDRISSKGDVAVNAAFRTLIFQDVAVNNPILRLVPDSQSKMRGTPPMVLGMDVLRELHLYIAYGEHVLYVTPATAH